MTKTTTRIIVISYNGCLRRFDLDAEGRLSFVHVARIFKIPLKGSDLDYLTLDDTSLRLDESFVTMSDLRVLFPLPSGTTEQPIVLQILEAASFEAVDPATPQPAITAAGRESALSPATHSSSAPTAAPVLTAIVSCSTANAASSTTSASLAAVVEAEAAGPICGGSISLPRTTTAEDVLPAGNCDQTLGSASPLRSVRTPLGFTLALPQPLSPGPASRWPGPDSSLLMSLAKPAATQDDNLFRRPGCQGSFHFSAAIAEHLPVLMACHLPLHLQQLLCRFTVPAQCTIIARAMALYAQTSQLMYFTDQRLEAAVTQARSCNPPQDYYCAYHHQATRLTGQKRKPEFQLHSTTSSLTPRNERDDIDVGASCNDVDMDAGTWAFIGGATLLCPGGGACYQAGRHENWLLSHGTDGTATYLPVLYQNVQHSTVLLPLTDPRISDTQVVPFCYKYESRDGRRGHNFWDYGLKTFLEESIRDVAGAEVLRAAGGA